MRNETNYDKTIFNKILLKIKSLLDEEKFDTIPEQEIIDDKNGTPIKTIEFYNNSIRIPIEIITPYWGGEVWEIQIISMSDGKRRYRGMGSVDSNVVAADIYAAYKRLQIKNSKSSIDEYIDELFS